MKKYIIWLVIFVVLLAAAVMGYKLLTENYTPDSPISITAQATSVPNGEPTVTKAPLPQASDFTVYDLDGKAASLSDFVGKPVVVNFWATWCEPCVTELPLFEELYKEYGDSVQFMMISLPIGGSTVETVKEFADANGYTFPVYFDTDHSASDAYGIRLIPQSLFIDVKGTLAESYSGSLTEETLSAYFDMIKPKAAE